MGGAHRHTPRLALCSELGLWILDNSKLLNCFRRAVTLTMTGAVCHQIIPSQPTLDIHWLIHYLSGASPPLRLVSTVSTVNTGKHSTSWDRLRINKPALPSGEFDLKKISNRIDVKYCLIFPQIHCLFVSDSGTMTGRDLARIATVP